jgi:hypothetical protein
MTNTGPEPASTSSWWRILLLGLGLFVLAVIVFAVTGNPNLFPTAALIGNFVVPVSYVAFFYERRHMSQVTLVSTARAFFYGGVLGVFAAALLEPVFIRQLTFLSAFEVGLIEEFAKILGVLVVARHHRHINASPEVWFPARRIGSETPYIHPLSRDPPEKRRWQRLRRNAGGSAWVAAAARTPPTLPARNMPALDWRRIWFRARLWALSFRSRNVEPCRNSVKKPSSPPHPPSAAPSSAPRPA